MKEQPDRPERTPAPWWAINGFGVLVALLEIFVGATGILDGPALFIDWVYRVGILLAGLGLLHGFLSRRVRVEAYAGTLMVAANLVDFTHETLTVWPPFIDWRSAAIQVIIIVGVLPRIWALTCGGVIVMPEWHRE